MKEANGVGFWTLIATLFSAAIAATWLLQESRISDRDKTIEALGTDIKSLVDAKDWRLPQTIERLNRISTKLDEQFKTQDDIAELAQQNLGYQSRITYLEASLNDAIAAKKLAELALEDSRKDLDRAFTESEVFSVFLGSSKELVQNHVTLGLLTHLSGSSAYVSLLNETGILNVGQAKEFTSLGKNCRLTLVSINQREGHSSFKMSCSRVQLGG